MPPINAPAQKPRKKKDRQFKRIHKDVAEEIAAFLFNVGNQYVNMRNSNAAFDCFRYSLELNDKNQPAVHNLGSLYGIMGNQEAAYNMYKAACRMKPNDLNARIAMGEVARKLGRLDEASEIVTKVLAEDPSIVAGLQTQALIKYDQGNLAEALAINNKVLDAFPSDLHLLLNKTLINMAYGEWADNWKYYEYCLSYGKSNDRMQGLSMSKAWSGEAYEGKVLLVISDQGFGDAVQFARYLPEAKKLGKFAQVRYLVQPDLKDLISHIEGIDEVLAFSEIDHVDFAAYSSLLGIMRVLGVSPENCRRPFKDVGTDPQLDALWEHRIGSASGPGELRVGFAWTGDPRHGNQHARSVPLQLMAKLNMPGVRLFSFQVGDAALRQLDVPVDGLDVVELGSQFRNFNDTASALKGMDLLVSCDTGVAHLSAAMGKPTWIMVPNPPEWRWLLTGTESPWYGSARLFRQPKPRDWESPMSVVIGELGELVKGNKKRGQDV